MHLINSPHTQNQEPYIKFHVELVFEHIVHRPAFAKPSGSLFVGLQAEPVVTSFLVVLHVLCENSGNIVYINLISTHSHTLFRMHSTGEQCKLTNLDQR